MTGFVPCSYPHRDFLLLGGEARKTVTNLAGLKRLQTDHATIFHNLDGDPTCTVSGIVIRDRTLTMGETVADRDGALHGVYCGILPTKTGGIGLELVADKLGTIPIYFAESAKGPMASNSIRLIALAMKAAGVPVRLSLGAIASTWCMFNYFTSTQVSRETYVSGVYIALLGQRIVFRGGQMSVSPAPTSQSPAPRIEEYRYLLDQGIEEIRENVISAVNSGYPVASTLTGGRDSRLVLGALLSVGRERDVHFITHRVNNVDENISTALAGYFGLSYQRPPDHVDIVGRSFEEDLERFTLANMGAKTLYKQSNVTAIFDEISIGFVGGSGELYRTTFTKGVKPEVLEAEVSEASVRKWLRSYPPFMKQAERIQEVAIDCWLDAFRNLGRRTIGESIDLHYANFRNRLHLGGPTQHRLDEKTVFFSPAASPVLFRLAQRLPRQALESDRLIYDLTRAFNFDLAHLPYDRPLHLRNPAVERRMKATQERITNRFIPSPKLLDMPSPPSISFSGYSEERSFKDFCLQQIENELDQLQEHPVAGQIVNETFRRFVGETIKTHNLERISTWLGKFRAARMVTEME